MNSKKPVCDPKLFDRELVDLYARRDLVDRAILLLEQYAQWLGQGPLAKCP